MKRFTLIMLIISATCVLSFAVKTETFNITFSENDFPTSLDANGNLEIGTKIMACYPEDNQPMLPLVATDFALTGNITYASSSFTVTKRLVKTNVKLAKSPLPVPSSSVVEENTVSVPDYPLVTFPASNCQYVCASKWDKATVLHFLSCPFIYDAAKKNLYFIDKIELKVNVNDSGSTGTPAQFGSHEKALIRGMVRNPEVIDGISLSPSNVADNNERVDYVIITNNTLKQAFLPLLNWKKTKGLYSKIVTVEEINTKFTSGDIQLKIKKYLQNLYQNNGLQYVCLGGDDSIVPIRGCYGKVSSTYIDATIPTDLYYGCFDGNFEWDLNNNGIYGELDDGLNLTPNVLITRIPIRTQQDVNNFITKLLSYEKKPLINNSILMGGVKLSYLHSTTGQSDSEIMGEILFDSYIKPHWNGERTRFYDTYTDFKGQESFNVTRDNLFQKLNDGYTFIDFNTHGNTGTWSMETGGSYTTSYAQQQSQVNHSIFITGACLTNAFDSNYSNSDPCLSEAFIRNEKNGVIAYLGSSRYGWTYSSENSGLGPSMKYEAQFYNKLFTFEIKNKNFGAIVRASKIGMISDCNYYSSYRWLQFSLNPIGDPEMPIFVKNPLQFNSAKYSLTKETLTLDTGVSDARVCIMSKEDVGNDYFKVFEDTQNLNLSSFPLKCNICITRQDYIPLQYSFCIIQNEIINSSHTYSYDVIKLGASITNKVPSGMAKLNGGTTILNAKNVSLEAGTTVGKGACLIITPFN
ncbi:MAG: hypothetical protein K2K81_08150 [Muribaculaceae bacterium]|nr:hypothetical protein [Muribaculaceae bacterium]